jgi:hypothetical protein
LLVWLRQAIQKAGNPRTDLKPQSPKAHVLAARVFRLYPFAPAPGVFYLKHCAIVQVLAARVFHINYKRIEYAFVPKVFRLHLDEVAPSIFHIHHHFIGQAFAPGRLFSTEIRLARTAGCGLLNIAHIGMAAIPFWQTQDYRGVLAALVVRWAHRLLCDLGGLERGWTLESFSLRGSVGGDGFWFADRLCPVGVS